MDIVDFAQQKATGYGTVSKYSSPRLDTAQNGLLSIDIDLQFKIDTDEKAGIVDGFVPGAQRSRDRATDDAGSSTMAAKPTNRAMKITLCRLTKERGKGRKVVAVPAEVRQYKFRVAQKHQTLTARLRLFGLEPKSFGSLAELYSHDAHVAVEFSQQVLQFPEQPKLEVGDVVAAVRDDTQFAGVVHEISADKITVDDFGRELVFAPGEVRSQIKVAVTDELLNRYRETQAARGVEASWQDIVTALGVAYARGSATRSAADTWDIDDDVIDAALGDLPAEASG